MIEMLNCEYEAFNFPAGEQHVVIKEVTSNPIDIKFDYENDAEIFKLMLIVNAIKSNGFNLGALYMDYVPYGRQDRITQDGECLSIKVFSDVINSLGFTEVFVIDTHSSVTTALLNNCYELKQEEVFEGMILDFGEHWLISPDGGALKKIYKHVNDNTLGVVECSKVRDTKTGEITGTKIYRGEFEGKNCVIVDDICDGGRTFIEIAKTLKASSNVGKIILCVTHGLFTKGLDVFDGLIDEIYIAGGRVK